MLSIPPSDEFLHNEFINSLEEISFTPAELTKWMQRRGDYRDPPSTARSIQRMVSGTTRVSGSMMVVVKTLVRQHRRLRQKYPNLVWKLDEYGNQTTQVENWFVYITPKSKGRWLLSCRSGESYDCYSPPFGRWLDTLEEAKNKVLMAVEDGMDDIAQFGPQPYAKET